MENLRTMMTEIDDIKDDIKEGKYLKLVDNLNNANKVFSKLYKLKYINQYHRSEFKDLNNPSHTKIDSEIKTQVVKFHEDWNESMINTFIENVGKLERIQSISFMGGKDDIPEIYHPNSFGDWIRSNPDEEDEDEMTLIKYNDVIPLAIEELN